MFAHDRSLSVRQPFDHAQDPTVIRSAQDGFSDIETDGRLAYVKANFGCLPSDIARFYEKGATRKFNKFNWNNRKWIGKCGWRRWQVGLKQYETCAREKRNTGYKAVCSIFRVLMGEEFRITEVREELDSV
jgi:hypothetical protein